MDGGADTDPARDLDSHEEIAEMVRRFYQQVAQDDLLGPLFNEVARVDWATHLPKLTAFWCRALLGWEGYSGNPFRAHALVHARSPFTPAHFERWLELFTDTVVLGWAGPAADRALALAHDVARVHSAQLNDRIPNAAAPAPPRTERAEP
ncbi:MAG: group III truncated hemoglobin [Microthrixaceae bacterium]